MTSLWTGKIILEVASDQTTQFQFPIPRFRHGHTLRSFKPVSLCPFSLAYSHINCYFQLHLLNSLLTFCFNLHREAVVRRKNNGPPIKFLIPLIYAPVLPLSMLLSHSLLLQTLYLFVFSYRFFFIFFLFFIFLYFQFV